MAGGPRFLLFIHSVHLTLEIIPFSLLIFLLTLRADIVCHWEDSDVIAQEVYFNASPFFHLVLSHQTCHPSMRSLPFTLYLYLTLLFLQDSLICVCIALALA